MNRILTINMTTDRGRLFHSFHYPAGEIQTRLTPEGVLLAKQAEEYEIITQSVPDIVELAQLVSALNGIGIFNTRSLFLRYFPYSRADRRFVEGDSFGLMTFMKLLSTLQFTTVWTFDVHNEKLTLQMGAAHNINIANMKPTDSPVDQIESCLNRMRAASGISIEYFTLISPDAGAHHRYDLGKYDMMILEGGKKRSVVTGELKGFTIDPRIKEYEAGLIVDDICDGGGTFIGLATEIKKHNPNIKLGLYVSHGIFSKGLAILDKHFDWVFQSDFSFIAEGDTNLGEKV